MNCYRFHPQTKRYLRTDAVKYSPKTGEPLLPVNSTLVEPSSEGLYWDEEGQEWRANAAEELQVSLDALDAEYLPQFENLRQRKANLDLTYPPTYQVALSNLRNEWDALSAAYSDALEALLA